jgi:hypothetical protein
VDEPVDHRRGDDVVAEDLAQVENGLLLVTIKEGALVARRDEREHQVGGLGIERDVADLVDDDERQDAEPAQLGKIRSVVVGIGVGCVLLSAQFDLAELIPGVPVAPPRRVTRGLDWRRASERLAGSYSYIWRGNRPGPGAAVVLAPALIVVVGYVALAVRERRASG